MINVRFSEERGRANFGWLDSRHTFSFGHYFDRNHMGSGPLRVINEDRVVGGAGFDTHGHQDMEIISYVLEGALEHKDSLGNGSVLRPGQVQRMTAGTGIQHSEFNHSETEGLHFLQIWILPAEGSLTPSYEEVDIPSDEKRGQLRLVGSPTGREGSLTIHQDVDLYVGLFDGDESAELEIPAGRTVWVQLAQGTATINGQEVRAGDGVSLTQEDKLEIKDGVEAELLVFKMAA